MGSPFRIAKAWRAILLSALAAALLALPVGRAGAEVRNLRLEQQGDHYLITYDLDDEGPASISALVAVNRRLLPHTALRVEGDVGQAIAPGKDKRIRWDVRRDFPGGLDGEVLISIQSGRHVVSEDEIVSLPARQAEAFRRIDAERLDVAAANRRTRFSGLGERLAGKIEGLVDSAYYRAADPALLEKSRFYCARFGDAVATRTLAVAAAGADPEFERQWEAARQASPEVGDANHARYFRCLLGSLDPHSSFLDPQEWRELQAGTRGMFGGLGMEVGQENGRLKVVTPIEDTPAQRAGIVAGDIVDQIDGVPTQGMTLIEAVRRLRGEPGTSVRLAVERKGTAGLLTITVTRAVIRIQSVKSRRLDDGYGYLRISQFQEGTDTKALEALRQLAAGGPLKGLILDLRNDPGGLLNGAVGVASIFLAPGQLVVSTDGRGRDAKARFTTTALAGEAPAWLKSVPMAVLVNQGSASASEIVAGALQDHRRAVVVGQRSFGKGSVQTLLPIDDAAVKLTTALYFTPSGRSIQRSGIVPEIAFEQDVASHEEAAEFARRLLARSAGVDAERRREIADELKVEEFFRLYRGAARGRIALAPAVATPVALSAAATAAAPVAQAEAGMAEHRVALVIGNAAYAGSPLRNPVADARAVAARLKTLGFQVLQRENLGFKEMMRAITQFGERLARKGSVGLFYYAGHGMQVRGKNYLIPVDAQISSEASVRSEAVDADSLLEQLAVSELGIVILDACRNNPFERRFRSGMGGGLAQMDAPKGVMVAYATAPGKVASDGEGQNGLYTQELLKVLGQPGLKVEDVFKRVRRQVAVATDDMQIPWEASSLTGDFYFARAASIAAPAAGDAELLFWQSIKDSRDADDFAAYLRNYPQGRFADIAKNRLRRLKSP